LIFDPDEECALSRGPGRQFVDQRRGSKNKTPALTTAKV
jgi:hypothetical protein